MNDLVGKPLILKMNHWYRGGRKKPRGNGGVSRVPEGVCQNRGHQDTRGFKQIKW